MFADIIVDIKHEKLDRIFQYRIPEWLKRRAECGNGGCDSVWERQPADERLCGRNFRDLRLMIFPKSRRSKIFPETV